MKTITKETTLAQTSISSRKKVFGDHSGIQKDKDRPTFSVWIQSAKIIFEADTGLKLFDSQKYNNFYRFISDNKEMELIEGWEIKRGKLVFLRDCLSLSVTMGFNLKEISPRKYTTIGRLENEAKYENDPKAIDQLAEMVSRTAQDLPYYKNADLICSVPPSTDKKFDLPSEVTSIVSRNLGKQDVTAGFTFNGEKGSIKNSKFEEKWGIWEKAQVSFENEPQCNVNGKTVILIDDKYQSGITIQYIAMKLQQAGAQEVYGLCIVKTRGDYDNA